MLCACYHVIPRVFFSFWMACWGSSSVGVPLNHRFYFRMFPEINHPAFLGIPHLWKPSHQHLDGISSGPDCNMTSLSPLGIWGALILDAGKREWMTIWCQKWGIWRIQRWGMRQENMVHSRDVQGMSACWSLHPYLRQWSQLADNFGMGWNSCKNTSTGNGTYLNNPIRINLPWSIFHSISKIWRCSEETLKLTMVFLGSPILRTPPTINTFHWKRCRKNDHESCWIVSSLRFASFRPYACCVCIPWWTTG